MMAAHVASLRTSRLSALRCFSPIFKRQFSSHGAPTQTQFSYALSRTASDPFTKMFDDLEAKPLLRNSSKHDAALVVASPEFARQFEDPDFMGTLARLLRGSSTTEQFHILGAIVDQVAAPLGSSGSVRGMSVLSGHIDHLLPNLWQPQSPKAKEDADTVSALSFSIGSPTVTLPLARTMFKNSRGSTLLASQFNLSHSSPRLENHAEKYTQRVCVSPPRQPHGIGDLGLWAPLLPLTPARQITESFGNIIRGIQVDEQSIPASTELEGAVNRLYETGGPLQLTPGSAGVWALVIPRQSPHSEDLLQRTSSLSSIFEDSRNIEELSAATAASLQQIYSEGGRLFKILSGGGGWGPKKGLLSLDPQRTHFALSEEEEMQRFMQSMNDAGFAPPGATVQFLMSVEPPPTSPEGPLPSVVFGVPGEYASTQDRIDSELTFMGGHFGALSSQGIFVADAESQSALGEMKLTVPHSRLYVTSDDDFLTSVGSKVAGTTAADAGFAALLL